MKAWQNWHDGLQFLFFFHLPARTRQPIRQTGLIVRTQKTMCRFLSRCQRIWINSMQTICQNECRQTGWDDIATSRFFFSWRTFPDNDKLSCDSPNPTPSPHPGWYVCNCRRRGLSYIFQPWNAAAPINTPTFSLFFFQTSCNMSSKKKKCSESLLSFSSISNHNRAIPYRGGMRWRGGIPKEPHIKKRDRPLIYWRQSNKYICWQLNRYLLCSLPQV